MNLTIFQYAKSNPRVGLKLDNADSLTSVMCTTGQTLEKLPLYQFTSYTGWGKIKYPNTKFARSQKFVDIFAPSVAHLLSTQLYTNLYLFDVSQIDRNTSFKSEFCKCTKGMARQALLRIHWQRTPDHWTPQTWTLSTTMCREPCLRNSVSWNRNHRT